MEWLIDALEACLGLGASDGAAVFYDSGSVEVARAISSALASLGVRPELVNIDSYGRPLNRLPPDISRLLRNLRPEATFYVAGVKPGELPFRSGLIDTATGLGASHVHMPRANMEILSKVAGCRETAKLIQRLHGVLSTSRLVTVESRAGTRLEARVGGYRWVADTGIIPRGSWGNWPPGEVYTTPDWIEGELIVDGVLGDYFSTKYGLLGEPVSVRIQGSTIVSIDGGPIARELESYLRSTPCGLRIGELGVGGNPKIEKPIGVMLHDEKMPGVHIAAGDPLGDRTGAQWACNVHVDMLPLSTNVKADSTTIIQDGKIQV